MVKPKSDTVLSPLQMRAGLFEQAFITDAMQSIADPNLHSCVGGMNAGPEVAVMQPADHGLEVKRCHAEFGRFTVVLFFPTNAPSAHDDTSC